MKVLLSAADKWSQKYIWFRNLTVFWSALLVISIISFFFMLSSVFLSLCCLSVSLLSALGIRMGLIKMDEFKALYVHTVPTISPERNFKEEMPFEEDEKEEESLDLEEQEMASISQELSTELKESKEVAEEPEVFKSDELEEVAEVLVSEGLEEEVEVLASDEFKKVTEVLEVKESENVSELKELEDALEIDNQASMSLEEQVFETIKVILAMNHCLVEDLSYKLVGKYLTIYVKSRVMMRLKLTGRKQYVLTYLSQEEVEKLGLIFEQPIKSEIYASRVQFTSIAVLAQLESHLVELYQRVRK